MKLFFLTLTIFFGTLMAAAVVALGEPSGGELAILKRSPPQRSLSFAVQVPRPVWTGEWKATASLSGSR